MGSGFFCLCNISSQKIYFYRKCADFPTMPYLDKTHKNFQFSSRRAKLK